MKTLAPAIKLKGNVSFKSKASFYINNLGFTETKALPNESFSIQNDNDAMQVCINEFPFFQVKARSTLLVSCKIEQGHVTTTIQTF
jgi:hypothetical protein